MLIGSEEVAVADDDDNHDRNAHQCRDGVDRQGQRLGQQVADQQQGGSREHRGRHQDAVVGRGEDHARQVRNGQPDEAHRTAEGRNGSREQDRREENQRARALDVESHRAGVVLAQQQEVQGFDDGDREEETRPDGRKHQQQAVARDVAQRPHGPDDERFQGSLVREILQDLDHRADPRTEHHAEDQDHHDVLDAAADGHDDGQYKCRSDPCGPGDAQRLDERMSGHAQQRRPEQEKRDAERSPGTDSQDIGPGQGIAEKRLHGQTAGCQGAPRQQGRYGFQQADLQDDGAVCRVAGPAGECRPDLRERDVDRSHSQIADEECGGRKRQQHEEQGRARHRLFEAFIIIGGVAAASQNGAQVAQCNIGVYGAGFPEIGASGCRATAVVVPDAAVHDGRNFGEFRVLGRQLLKGVATPDIEPEIGAVGQQVGLFQIHGHRGIRTVPGVDVASAGIFDQPDHVALDGRHEPCIPVGRVQHHLRAGIRRVEACFQGVVARGDAAQRIGSGFAQIAQFRRGNQPFGLAQGRPFDVIADIEIGNAQFAEFPGDDRILSGDSVEEDQVGVQGRQEFEVEVRVVPHVADFAAEAAPADGGVEDIVESRDADDAVGLVQGVEQCDVARRHAYDAPNGGLDGLYFGVAGSFGLAAQEDQVLIGLRTALPRIVDGDEGRGIFLGTADVESRGVGRAVNRCREVA